MVYPWSMQGLGLYYVSNKTHSYVEMLKNQKLYVLKISFAALITKKVLYSSALV